MLTSLFSYDSVSKIYIKYDNKPGAHLVCDLWLFFCKAVVVIRVKGMNWCMYELSALQLVWPVFVQRFPFNSSPYNLKTFISCTVKLFKRQHWLWTPCTWVSLKENEPPRHMHCKEIMITITLLLSLGTFYMMYQYQWMKEFNFSICFCQIMKCGIASVIFTQMPLVIWGWDWVRCLDSDTASIVYFPPLSGKV